MDLPYYFSGGMSPKPKIAQKLLYFPALLGMNGIAAG
jgi:ABC-type phosphonate transport system ATPase subunit